MCETFFNEKEKRKKTFLKILLLKSFRNLTNIFIVIVRVLFTFYLVRCVAYRMFSQLLIDFV